MEIKFEKVGRKAILHLRERYMLSLPEPQELFLEMKVRHAQAYLVIQDEITAGYLLLSGEGELLEFYLEPLYYAGAEAIADQLIRELAVKCIWCKSFDRLLLSLCTGRKMNCSVEGFLFREWLKRPDINLPAGTEIRPASDDDRASILEINDSFFESPAELDMVLHEEILFCFLLGKKLIGCGTLMKILPGSHVYDLGMLVNPGLRKKSYGSAIVNYLADYCTGRGWRPVCGCAAANLASRKTLEKAGFVTRDRMLKFEV